MNAAGKVWLVGAGPGAPDLLTLRAARLLAEADIVFHDALVHPEVLALATTARRVAVGKRHGRVSTAQGFINRALVAAARRHRTVVRLKGGDPMVFGRAQEEIDALAAAGVAWEVVPGVTAALAASAVLGRSLTRRGISRGVAIVTPSAADGHDAPDWLRQVAHADSAVLYMAARRAARVTRELLGAGRRPTTPVAVVESASLPGQRVLRGTLAELPALAGTLGAGPAVVLLGDAFAQDAADAGAAGGDGVPRGRWADVA